MNKRETVQFPTDWTQEIAKRNEHIENLRDLFLRRLPLETIESFTPKTVDQLEFYRTNLEWYFRTCALNVLYQSISGANQILADLKLRSIYIDDIQPSIEEYMNIFVLPFWAYFHSCNNKEQMCSLLIENVTNLYASHVFKKVYEVYYYYTIPSEIYSILLSVVNSVSIYLIQSLCALSESVIDLGIKNNIPNGKEPNSNVIPIHKVV